MTVISRWRATFSSLENRNYRWYWLSATASAAVMQMNILARGWLVYDLTGSYADMGLVSFAAGVPLFVLSPFGGVITDRWSKRTIIILSQFLLCAVVFSIAMLILLDAIALWHLVIAAVVNGVMLAFNLPSRQAIVPQLVEEGQVMNAVALNSGSQNVMRILAPGAGGIIMGFLGVAQAYFVMVGFALASALLMFLVHPAEGRSFLTKDMAGSGILDGLRYVRRSWVLLGLLIMAIVPVMFGMPYTILLAGFARDVLSLGEAQSGALYSAAGIGAFAGSILVAFLGDFRRKGLLLMTSAVVFGICLVLLGESNAFYIPFAILVGVGMSNGIYLIANNTLLLLHSEESMRGRVMGLYTMSIGLLPMAAWPIGATMDTTDPRTVFVACGGIIALFAVLMMWLRPELRRL